MKRTTYHRLIVIVFGTILTNLALAQVATPPGTTAQQGTVTQTAAAAPNKQLQTLTVALPQPRPAVTTTTNREVPNFSFILQSGETRTETVNGSPVVIFCQQPPTTTISARPAHSCSAYCRCYGMLYHTYWTWLEADGDTRERAWSNLARGCAATCSERGYVSNALRTTIGLGRPLPSTNCVSRE